MFVQFENFLGGLLSSMGVAESYNFAIILLISTVIVAVICFLADYIAKKIMLTLLMQFAKKSKTVLDDILVEKRFFHRLAQLAPALVVYLLAPVILHRFPTTIYWVQIALKSFIIFVGMRVVDSFLNSMHAMYHLLPDSKHKPING